MWWAWIFLAVVIFTCVANIAMGVLKGEMWGEYYKISRKEKPRLFMGLMVFQLFALLAFVAAGLLLVVMR